MNGQICNVCGNQITDNLNGTLIFCTNCGASLINQYPNPNQQNFNPNPPVQQGFYNPKPKQPLTGKEKFGMGALIVVPILLILGTIGIIGFFVVAVSNRMPPPRTKPSPYSSPVKTKNTLLSFGTSGFGEGQFKNASAIAVGKDGSIYVGDGTLRIQKFDSTGKFVKLWNVTESTSKTNDQYSNKITNLAIDSKNTLYAVVEKKELLRYDANTGKFNGKVELNGEKWMNNRQEARVLDVFMQNDDKLAVFASSFPEGEYIITVSPEGKGEIKHKDLLKKQDKNLRVMMGGGILVSVTGDIFLLNGYIGTTKPYIYRFKSDGSYVDRFTWEGAPFSGIFSNNVLALNSKGEIYAYNSSKKQVNVLNVEGVQVRSIPIGSDYFEKITVDAADNIFVLNRDKVEKYSPDGN